MFAYLVAGLIVGGLMWFLQRRPGDPPVAIQLGVGVLAGGLAGLVVNVLSGDDFLAISAWGFAAAALAGAGALLFVKSRSRRREAEQTIDG
jgi:hypothetical protein